MSRRPSDTASRRSRPSVGAWLRRTPGPRDLSSMVAAGIARLLLRRRPLESAGFVSDESPVIIAGMHRSGTSLVSRLLERSGMYLGGSWVDRNHEALHFKRANMAMTGEGFYKVHDYGWAAPKTEAFVQERCGYAERAAMNISRFFAGRTDEPAWGWKDPRNCLTLPVWLSVYPRARVLHVVRDGRPVALSLTDRDRIDPAFGLALWAYYVTRAERGLEKVPDDRKLTIRFEDLIDAPETTLRMLYAFAGSDVPETLESIVADVDVQRNAARTSDPRIAEAGDHPLLARYGYC